MKRRGFVGALAAIVAVPSLVKGMVVAPKLPKSGRLTPIRVYRRIELDNFALGRDQDRYDEMKLLWGTYYGVKS